MSISTLHRTFHGCGQVDLPPVNGVGKFANEWSAPTPVAQSVRFQRPGMLVSNFRAGPTKSAKVGMEVLDSSFKVGTPGPNLTPCAGTDGLMCSHPSCAEALIYGPDWSQVVASAMLVEPPIRVPMHRDYSINR